MKTTALENKMRELKKANAIFDLENAIASLEAIPGMNDTIEELLHILAQLKEK